MRLRIGERHIGLTGQLQVIGNLSVAAEDLQRFDRRHRVGHEAHVKCRRGAAEDDRCTGLCELRDGEAAEHLGGVQDQCAYGGDVGRFQDLGACSHEFGGLERALGRRQ